MAQLKLTITFDTDTGQYGFEGPGDEVVMRFMLHKINGAYDQHLEHMKVKQARAGLVLPRLDMSKLPPLSGPGFKNGS